MEEENKKLELFAETDDEIITLDEEDPEQDSSADENGDPERQFGGKNIFFLCMILLLAVLTISLMLGVFDRQEPNETSEAGQSDASQAMMQSDPESESSSASSSEESVIELSDPSDTSAEESTPEETVESDFHGWIINNLGYTYLYHGVGVEQFNYSDATLGKYISSVQSLKKQIPGGTSVYCMPVPTRIGFLYSEISADVKREDNFFNSSQQAFLDTLEEKIGNDLSFVNLYQAFSESYRDGEELFFKTDLNWTADAAYLAYKQFCAASGNAAVSLEAYEERQIENFLGTFYTATESEILKANADVFRYYKNTYTDACKVTLYSGSSVYKNYSLCSNTVTGNASAYSVYLGTTGQHFKLETACTSGKKLLVVGDGSATAMLPFLVTNYTEIHYIDIALYRDSFASLFASDEYNDVLLMTYATNAVKGTYPDHLATMAGVQQDG